MVRFGPAGNDVQFYEDGNKRTIEAPKWLSKLGLTAYEYSFGRGITLNDDTAVAIGEEFKKYDIAFSIHAPYYINFATPTDELAENSYNYVLRSLEKLKKAGGNRLVVHPASCGKMDRKEALALTMRRLTVLKDKLIENGFEDMYICLETMGKHAQIGTYEEVVEMCKIYDHYIPTFDFGHINAFTNGGIKTKEDYAKILDCAMQLGEFRGKHFHVHFSKIEYTEKGGEVKHLTMEDNVYGPDFEPFAELCKERGLEPVIICESRGCMATDAVILKEIYEKA